MNVLPPGAASRKIAQALLKTGDPRYAFGTAVGAFDNLASGGGIAYAVTVIAGVVFYLSDQNEAWSYGWLAGLEEAWNQSGAKATGGADFAVRYNPRAAAKN